MTTLQVQRESPLVCINCDRLSPAIRCVTLRGGVRLRMTRPIYSPFRIPQKFRLIEGVHPHPL